MILLPLLIAAKNMEISKFKGYKKIVQNKLRVQLKKALYDKCACRLIDASPCSRENGCINVVSSIECSPKFCPAKNNCRNQNFRRGVQFAFQIRKTQSKGYGFYAVEEIPANSFIIEYMGEVIDYAEFKKRFETNEDENFYYLAISQSRYIDARIYGNESRFVNHSCEPNAIADKWIVHSNDQEHTRVGLFSLRKIHSVNNIQVISIFTKTKCF